MASRARVITLSMVCIDLIGVVKSDYLLASGVSRGGGFSGRGPGAGCSVTAGVGAGADGAEEERGSGVVAGGGSGVRGGVFGPGAIRGPEPGSRGAPGPGSRGPAAGSLRL